MRSIDNETRRTMNTRRNFVNYATMTLSDGTVLHLTPSDFRISGNSFTDDWNDGESFQMGSAIGKTATLLLDNTDGRVEEIANGISDVYPHGKFSEYDFYMAYFTLYVCLPEAYHYEGELRDQMIRIGTFTVTTPTSHGSTIEITGVDNMYMFDKSFDDCDLDFTTTPTLLTILNKCCEDCGVAIGYGGFNNQNLTVSKKPEGVTYRQVVSYIAQIAGCNAKISETGALTLVWYDMSVFTDNWLDGGSFTAIGEEFQHGRTSTYDTTQKSWGYNLRYRSNSIPRSGRYKITRINISNISDPANFDADYELYTYNSLDYGESRFNATSVVRNKLIEGDNIVNLEFDITTLNRIVYWFGVVGNNFGDPNAATFDFTVYIEPVSYNDLDSADGGTFESEFQYYTATHWVYSGETISSDYWSFYNNITFQYIKPAGRYNITRVYVDNIADISHFNAEYTVQKSIDSGSTWTNEQTGTLIAGDNIINFDVDIPENIETRYRVRYRQNVVADPNASAFDATLYMKANDLLYLDGDSFDGGDFATPLEYHNLTATNGTSVSTDDIQFTGVLVSYDDVSVNYPTIEGWNYYALEVTENPFVVGNESTIATYLYNRLSSLKFRPFTTSSIQDPTIEAGDCALVYDVKGNMYKTVITNVTFKTGGMTEVSCNAEPPARQNSRYVNPAAQAVAKAEKKMDDYNAQVAHFNELAGQALGYYKTEEIDPQTSATITYIHDEPTLATSTIIWKITADGIFISEDGGQSYNAGYDASTGTMLMNLIYAHGITADWIKTGTLTLGGLNNTHGTLYILDASGTEIGSWDKDGINATAGQIAGFRLSNNLFSSVESGSGYTASTYIGPARLRFNYKGTSWPTDSYIEWSRTNGYFEIQQGHHQNHGGLFVRKASGDYSGYTQIMGEYILTDEVEAYTFTERSDERLKEDIKTVDAETAQSIISKLRPVTYRAKKKPEVTRLGLIAQELRSVIDEVIPDNDYFIEHSGSDGYRGIDYVELLPWVISVVQNQQKQIDELKQEIAELKHIVNNQ